MNATNTTTTREQLANDPLQDSTPAMLQVFTTPQTAPERCETVQVDARNGKNPDGTKREVANEDRTRVIVIPELSVDGVPSKFQSIVLDALRKTAKEQLSSLWKAEPMIREVPAAIWNVDSILLFAAREAESKRLTKATLEDWFDTSDLAKRIMAKGDSKLLSKWKALIVGFAAPMYLEAEENCTAVIASVGVADAEEDNIIGQQIIAKANKRIADLQKVTEAVEAV